MKGCRVWYGIKPKSGHFTDFEYLGEFDVDNWLFWRFIVLSLDESRFGSIKLQICYCRCYRLKKNPNQGSGMFQISMALCMNLQSSVKITKRPRTLVFFPPPHGIFFNLWPYRGFYEVQNSFFKLFVYTKPRYDLIWRSSFYSPLTECNKMYEMNEINTTNRIKLKKKKFENNVNTLQYNIWIYP